MIRIRPLSKAERPETLRQAITWESVKRNYLQHGLCDRCAGQAAWGHQIGFSRLEQLPCGKCWPAVQRLPKAQPDGWRSVYGDAAVRRSDVGAAIPSTRAASDVRTDLSGERARALSTELSV